MNKVGFLNHILKKFQLPYEIIYKILCNLKKCYYCNEIILGSVFCNKCLEKWEKNLYNNYLKKLNLPTTP